MDVRPLWDDVMGMVGAGAETGDCACAVFRHVTEHENFGPVTDEAIAILYGIATHSESEDALVSNVGHFLTAVIALGYAIGASDAYDTTLSSDVSVPDSLAALDLIESFGERPDDN